MTIDAQDTYQRLRHTILALADFPDELIDRLYAICRPRHYKKGEFFVMAGDVPEDMGFNLDGLFRLYYLDDEGNDHTKGFSTPGKFIISYSALSQQRPSYFYIEALADSDILQFSYHQLMTLVEEDNRWYRFLFKLLETVYIMKEMREKDFLLESATSRYLTFREEYPVLEKTIKLHHIASFIGVTPEALSRIRRRLR